MEFTGETTLEGIPPDEAWMFLTDPVAIRKSLRGCKYITPMDEDFSFDDYEPDESRATIPKADYQEVRMRSFEEGQSYAALMETGIGPVTPRFEAQLTVEERDDARHRMVASGEGNSSNSSFEMEAEMTIKETDGGSMIDWDAQADVFGRLEQLGGRVIEPATDEIVNDFFDNIDRLLTKKPTTSEGDKFGMLGLIWRVIRRILGL